MMMNATKDLHRCIYFTFAWILTVSTICVTPAAAKYDRTDQAVPLALVYADDAKINGTRPQAVMVDKQRQVIALYQFDGKWRESAQWDCSTGKIKGPKVAEGDGKTPEGIYFTTKDVGARYLSETYGSRALPLNYPNRFDRYDQRSGSAIWIHGTNKPLVPFDSNGCVVMDNAAISQLAQGIAVYRTPVIIVDHIIRASLERQRNDAGALLELLHQWRHALNHGSYAAFRTLYDPTAQPTMGWWRKWCKQRSAYSVGPGHQSDLRRRMIVRHGKRYVALFDHYLATATHRVLAGRRALYLESRQDGFTIVGEVIHDSSAPHTDKLLQAWKKLWKLETRSSKLASGQMRPNGS